MTLSLNGGGLRAKEISQFARSSIVPIGSPWTSDWVDLLDYEAVKVAVKTDQDTTIKVEFSPDGVNADSTLTRYYRTGQINAPEPYAVMRRFVRIYAENTTSTEQTYFRCNVLAGDMVLLNIPIDAIMSQAYSAIATRPSDFHSEVALGRRQGVTLWNSWGYNSDIDTGGPEVIASFGGTFQYLTSGETITIVSASAADDGDPAGTGVNSIVVYGVDENWDTVIETFTMDGITPVISTSQWIGINRVAVFLSGSGNTNAGDITVTATNSGYTMAQMPAGEAVTQQMIFYVAQKHQYLAEWLHFEALKLAGGAGNPELLIKGWVYSAVNQTEQLVYNGKMDIANQNHLNLDPSVPFPIGEKSIIWFEVTTDKDNTSVDARMSGELFRDPDG